jgi:hypothetical protein
MAVHDFTLPDCIVEAVAIRRLDGSRWKLHALRAYLTDDNAINVVRRSKLDSPDSFCDSLRKPFQRLCCYLTAGDLRLPEGPYGFPWHKDVQSEAIRFALIDRYKLVEGLDTMDLRVVYHGTDKAYLESILGSRLRAGSEPAMLGLGVYFGSFWKACRYAMFKNSRYHDTVFRDVGVILRIVLIIHREKILKLPHKDHTCRCFKCENRIRCSKSESERKHRINKASLCDHDGRWASSYDAISIEDTLGTMTHGELCVKDSKIRDTTCILDFGVLDPRSRSETYEPERKDHRILVVPDGDDD